MTAERNHRSTRRPPAAVLVVAVGMGLAAGACTGNDTGSTAGNGPQAAPAYHEAADGYSVEIDPAGFVDTIDNPYMPLVPGSTWRLEGQTEDGHEVDSITVTDQTREVMGVTTTVVKDVVELEGEVVEKTWDWFAQDVRGNVWYFGEDTAEYENGEVVSRAGAWEAGIDGALPGIVMPADPTVSDAARQEFYAGEAEDMGWVVETGISKEVPAGSFDDVVRMLEWSPVEPRVVNQKLFARGVGLIGERNLAGGLEEFELVEHTAP